MKKYLHNWVVPHSGNNHKPHLLHHHHLFAHAVFAVVMKGFFMGTLLLLPSSMLLASDAFIKQRLVIVEMTNAIRTSLGIPALKETAQLINAATAKAEHMSELEYFSHFGPDGKNHADWLNVVGYDFSIAGENLAVGFSTPQGIVSGWQKSPTHYANMIDPAYTETGVGFAPGQYKGKSTNYVAQFFGSRAASVNTVEYKNGTDQIDTDTSAISARKVDDGIALDITAYAKDDTEFIEVFFEGRSVELTQDLLDTKKWVGETLVKKEQIKSVNPLVLATAVSKNDSGEVIVQDIKYDQVDSLMPGFLKNYSYYKQNPSELVQKLIDFMKSYYIIVIGLLTISLVLGIFTEMKKKHPHVVASSMGLILLLLLLIRY